MRYKPSDLFSKLQDLGISVSVADPLRQKITEVRGRRYRPIRSVEDKMRDSRTKDYTPDIQGKKGRPLLEIPKDYVKDVLNFVGYLADTKTRSFVIKMRNVLTGECFVKVKPYVHRWTDVYRRGVLAKFYQLEAYLKENPKPAILISLTVSTRYKTYEEVIDELAVGRKKLLDVLRWKFGAQDYFWSLEPHQSGFAHLHLIYFYSISESDQAFLKTLWSEKYGYGSYDNGLNFSLPRASSDGSCPAGSISCLRNYAMKYVSKGLHSGSSHEIEFMGLKVPFEMSLGELLFNAILKKTNSRLWGCSRHFSQIMKRPEKEKDPAWECVEVDQYYGVHPDEKEFYPDETDAEVQKHFFSVLWTKESGLRPDKERVWRWYNTVPTWCFAGSESESDYKLRGFRFEEFERVENGNLVQFTRLYEPVWVSLS